MTQNPGLQKALLPDLPTRTLVLAFLHPSLTHQVTGQVIHPLTVRVRAQRLEFLNHATNYKIYKIVSAQGRSDSLEGTEWTTWLSR